MREGQVGNRKHLCGSHCMTFPPTVKNPPTKPMLCRTVGIPTIQMSKLRRRELLTEYTTK